MSVVWVCSVSSTISRRFTFWREQQFQVIMRGPAPFRHMEFPGGRVAPVTVAGEVGSGEGVQEFPRGLLGSSSSVSELM